MQQNAREQHDSGTCEQEKTAAACLPYLPRVLARELAREPDRPLPWITRIDATMVMGDISGFTAMSERLASAGKEGAERLTDIINSFFDRLLGIADAYGGDTLTFAGDAVLLLFSGERHAERAVAASLAMLAATDAIPAYPVGSDRIKLGMSMGAHSASFPFVAVGSSEQAHLLAVGPDPSRTAQAESAAESGQIVVSEATRDLLGTSADLARSDAEGWIVRALSPSVDAIESPVDEPTPSFEQMLPYLPSVALDVTEDEESVRRLEGEHRAVTTVFVNVTGIDTLLHDDPAALVHELQRYVSDVMDLLRRWGGFLVSSDIATDGIKLICTFGAPIAREHDTENAARFALALRDRLASRSSRLAHRFGVNRASVYAGQVGSTNRRQYTVMGDGVNLAARLMAYAQPGTIVGAQNLVPLLRSVECLELGSTRVKGKSAPIGVCELVAEDLSQQDRAGSAAGLPLMGRKAEVEAIGSAFEGAASDAGRVVLVTGEPGIGKSRLVDEAISAFTSKPWRVLRLTFYEHTAATPFAPWVRALHELLDLGEELSPGLVAETAIARVDALVPHLSDYAPLLGPLLGISIPESLATATMTPQARRRGILLLLSEIVRAHSRRAPFALVVEDLHWADESSYELLELLAAEVGAQPGFVLLLTSRTEPALTQRVAHDSLLWLRLESLAADEARAMVSAVSGEREVPEHIARFLVSKAGGNPLFLEEIVRSLDASGALERLRSASEVAASQELARIDFPDRVQGLLMSRIDALEPERKRTLRLAAVIGQVFDVETVSVLVGDGHPRKDLADDLDILSEQKLILPAEDRGQFRFRHALVQEVAYGSLRFDQRRSIHHQLAAYLESHWGDEVDSHLDAVTRHYHLSGDAPKTLEYAVRAAEKARTMYAHAEAVDYSRMALDVSRARNTRSALLRSGLMERIGDGCQTIGRHAEAIDAFRDSLRRWQRIEDVLLAHQDGFSLPAAVPKDSGPLEARYAVLCHKIALSYERQNRRYDLADRWVMKALERLPGGCTPLRAWMYTTRGIARGRQGDVEEAVKWSRQAVECARAAGDDSGLAWALNQLSVLYGDRGDLQTAIATQREAVTLLEGIGDLERLASAYGNLANCLMQHGELEEALRYNEKALALDERIGASDRIRVQRANIGEIEVVLRHYAEAREVLEQALKTEQVEHGDALEGFILANLSRAYAGLGELGLARNAIERALVLLRQAGAQTVLAEATVQLADVLRREGRCTEAANVCDHANDELTRRGNRVACVRALRVQGRALADSGDLAAGRAKVLESIDLARRTRASAELAHSERTLAEITEASSRTAEQEPAR